MNMRAEAPARHRLLIDLCLRYLVPFFWRGPGLLVISRVGVDAILEDLERQEIKVLGLDAFELDGADVHPRLDLIYDSDRSPRSLSPTDAVATWPGDLWVDVTIGTLP